MATSQPISVTTSTFTVTSNHNGGLLVLNVASGVGVTLPAATGSFMTLDILVGTSITSLTSFVKVAPGTTDSFAGSVRTNLAAGAAGASFLEAATGTDDTLTMNGGTTGGIAGSSIKLMDIAPNLWRIDADLIGSGAMVSTLSATV